ncbi:hypothetical protein SPBR_07417 [Sporothrix brasiliensis 5110]|uniref:Uncharacterized protein n=1 Tax=Sporothrix brasiliensis 5110 TaxID=1398154 RepID=A0A0C2IWF8_9PEZI|nr:uncharacterized protein SPBR_07417 [Sporothrix brasiliensis 5110]KIH89327.1 hypothetical protein SPBR_07417 [Sporothrix brasiliensis 5110]
MHDTQYQEPAAADRPQRRAAPDAPYKRCRSHDPIVPTCGPPIPDHMLSHANKVAANMRAGRFVRRPTFVLGLRAVDATTQALAARILRGPLAALCDDTAALLAAPRPTDPATATATATARHGTSILELVRDAYALEPGRPWTLWAFRDMWDRCPVALKSAEDAFVFLHVRLAALERHEGDPTELQLFVHFVVEASPTWPKLFAVTYVSDGDDDDGDDDGDDDNGEEEDGQEAEMRDMEDLKLDEETKATQKRMERQGRLSTREIEKDEIENGAKGRRSASRKGEKQTKERGSETKWRDKKNASEETNSRDCTGSGRCSESANRETHVGGGFNMSVRMRPWTGCGGDSECFDPAPSAEVR